MTPHAWAGILRVCILIAVLCELMVIFTVRHPTTGTVVACSLFNLSILSAWISLRTQR